MYELQNYLIEIATRKKEDYDGMNFEKFYSWLLRSIRSEPHLWIPNSSMHKRVVSFVKELHKRYKLIKEIAKKEGRQIPKLYVPALPDD